MTAAPPSARRAHSSCVVAGATGADAATSCQVGTLAAQRHACGGSRAGLLFVEGFEGDLGVLFVALNTRPRQAACSCAPTCRNNTSRDHGIDVTALCYNRNRVHRWSARAAPAALQARVARRVQRHQAGAHRELAPLQAPGQEMLRDAVVAVRQRGREQRAGGRGAPAAAARRLAAAHGGVRARQELGRGLRAHGVARHQRDQVAPGARRDATCLT